MAKIDNDKMWESILSFRISEEEEKELMDSNPLQAALFFIGQSIKKGLKDQGLEYNPETKEIQEIDYLWNGEIRVRKVTGVLKKMLDNLDEESLAKTREKMLEETELTDFEKVLAECIHKAQGSVLSPEWVAITWSNALMAEARKQIASDIKGYIHEIPYIIKDGYIVSEPTQYFINGMQYVLNKIEEESV